MSRSIQQAMKKNCGMTYVTKPRYEGVRWNLIFGSYEGVEQFAVNELQRMIQRYLPYVIEVKREVIDISGHKENLILVGTRDNNKYIKELVNKGFISIPAQPQGYTAACFKSPYNSERKIIVIAGNDASGVLYGVEDFNAKILAFKVVPSGKDHPHYMRPAFDGIEDFTISEYPLIESRGIWTWGIGIHDYRRFIDNMARLKMNMLIMWHDCPPINCKDIIHYAHTRGVKVILGFHWGWELEGIDLSSKDDRLRIKAVVLRNYNENYRGLGMDGIYFQTLTEHCNLEIKGKTTASLVCELVNDISSELLKNEADLHIQFGLHATSIREYYTDLKPLNSKVLIVWENIGVDRYNGGVPADLQEQAIAYLKKLVSFRGKSAFGMVMKGFACQNYVTEWEHHGSFIQGERHPDFIKTRLMKDRLYYDTMNDDWLIHHPFAVKVYREMLKCSPVKTTITGLIEDGMLEESIQPSYALFAESIWNPNRNEENMIKFARSHYYKSF